MSDDLRRFAASLVDGRSTGTIRPRVASRFEGVAAVEIGEPAAQRSRPAAASDEPREPDRVKPGLAPGVESVAAEGIAARTPGLERSATSSVEPGRATSSMRPAETRPTLSSSPIEVQTSRPTVSPFTPATRTRASAVQPEAKASIQSRERSEMADTPAIAASRGLAAIESPGRLQSMPERLAESPSVLPRPEPTIRTDFDAAIGPAMAPRRAEPSSNAPTVVQVTIASVEVRQPAPPPRRPPIPRAAPGPRLTLREYLQRRNEGRR